MFFPSLPINSEVLEAAPIAPNLTVLLIRIPVNQRVPSQFVFDDPLTQIPQRSAEVLIAGLRCLFAWLALQVYVSHLAQQYYHLESRATYGVVEVESIHILLLNLIRCACPKSTVRPLLNVSSNKEHGIR